MIKQPVETKKVSNPSLRIYLWISGFVFSLGYLGIHFLPVSKQQMRILLDSAYLIPPTLAVLGGYFALKKVDRTEKRFWLFLMLANLLLLIGDIIWIYYEIVLKTEPAQPSIADCPYLLSYVFFFLLLLSMARLSNAFALTKARYLLDTAVVILFGFIMVWFFLLRPLYLLYPDASVAERVINSVYPILDLGIIFGIFANLFGFKSSKWRSWQILIALGLTFYAVADLIFNYFAAVNIYLPENIWASSLDLAWLWGYFLFFMAAAYRLSKKEAPARSRARIPVEKTSTKWSDVVVPIFVVVTIPFFILQAINYSSSILDQWMFVGAATLLAMIIVARAGVVIAENKNLFSHSITDAVTGLFNRRFFQERISLELETAKKHRENLSVAILDIDNFGQMNDVYGHVAGDRILHDVGQGIGSACRISDTVCRIGGDEFGLIMPQTNAIQAFKVCERTQRQLRKIRNYRKVEIRVSAGIACFPIHGSQKEDLEKKADGALYWAKYHGKGQIIIFDPHIVKTMNVEERIKRAEEAAYLNTVHALAAAVDARDHYTQFHSRHVASLAVLLAEKLGLDRNRISLIEIAALLHDVGKIGIPDRILKKPRGLSESEKQQITEHPKLSKKILATTTLKEILPWILSHHERWDGKGYPQRLKDKDIPLEARILAICDAYDAMTSDRPYRKALSREDTLEELQKGKGTQFDPQLLETFIELLMQTEKPQEVIQAAKV